MFRAKLRNKLLKLFLSLSLIFVLCNISVYAAGEGDGGGGGPSVPLYMDWACPTDGETNVSITPIIQCKYSHNVAQYDVRDRNIKLFSLTDEEGTEIPINVFVADAQLEFDKRQYIYLIPIKPLKNNTTYTVTAAEGVQAKNGMVTEEEQSFSFTTGKITVALAATDEQVNNSSCVSITQEDVTADTLGNAEKEQLDEQLEERENVKDDVAENTAALNQTQATDEQVLELNKGKFSIWFVWIGIFIIMIVSFGISVIAKSRTLFKQNI